MATENINRNCIKESTKLPLRNVTQIIKLLLLGKKTRTIKDHLLNTGNWQIRNFTHEYPGVLKASINHATSIQEDAVFSCTQKWK